MGTRALLSLSLAGVMVDLEKFYSTYMPVSQIATSFDQVDAGDHITPISDSLSYLSAHVFFLAAHGWITQNYGNPCSHFGSPFIQNCQVIHASACLGGNRDL